MVGFLTILFVLFIVIMAFSGRSKASTFKGQFNDGLSSLTTLTGNSIAGVGERLKSESIQSQIKKINLKSGFRSIYQEHQKVLFLYSSIDYPMYYKKELTDEIISKLISLGIKNDNELQIEVESNKELFYKCKELGIQNLTLVGCSISPYDSTDPIKEDEVIEPYKVGDYRFEKRIKL